MRTEPRKGQSSMLPVDLKDIWVVCAACAYPHPPAMLVLQDDGSWDALCRNCAAVIIEWAAAHGRDTER